MDAAEQAQMEQLAAQIPNALMLNTTIPHKNQPTGKSVTGFTSDPLLLRHKSKKFAHEGPRRLSQLTQRIKATHLLDRCTPVPVRRARDDEVLLTHTQKHLTLLKSLEQRQYSTSQPFCFLDEYQDTYACAESTAVCLSAAGGAIDLGTKIARGELKNGFAAIRPPGHHCGREGPQGFCLVNNVAIAANAIRASHPEIQRILIVDWDVHHGNGTEEIFLNDPDILFYSMHRREAGFFPESGDATLVGGPSDNPTIEALHDVLQTKTRLGGNPDDEEKTQEPEDTTTAASATATAATPPAAAASSTAPSIPAGNKTDTISSIMAAVTGQAPTQGSTVLITPPQQIKNNDSNMTKIEMSDIIRSSSGTHNATSTTPTTTSNTTTVKSDNKNDLKIDVSNQHDIVVKPTILQPTLSGGMTPRTVPRNVPTPTTPTHGGSSTTDHHSLSSGSGSHHVGLSGSMTPSHSSHTALSGKSLTGMSLGTPSASMNNPGGSRMGIGSLNSHYTPKQGMGSGSLTSKQRKKNALRRKKQLLKNGGGKPLSTTTINPDGSTSTTTIMVDEHGNPIDDALLLDDDDLMSDDDDEDDTSTTDDDDDDDEDDELIDPDVDEDDESMMIDGKPINPDILLLNGTQQQGGVDDAGARTGAGLSRSGSGIRSSAIGTPTLNSSTKLNNIGTDHLFEADPTTILSSPSAAPHGSSRIGSSTTTPSLVPITSNSTPVEFAHAPYNSSGDSDIVGGRSTPRPDIDDPAERAAAEQGNPAASGRTVNVPLPTPLGDIDYINVIKATLLPIAIEFKPSLIIVSAGYDPSPSDPLGGECVTAAGFYAFTRLLMSINSKVMVCLEGGYSPSDVADCGEATLRALLDLPFCDEVTCSDIQRKLDCLDKGIKEFQELIQYNNDIKKWSKTPITRDALCLPLDLSYTFPLNLPSHFLEPKYDHNNHIIRDFDTLEKNAIAFSKENLSKYRFKVEHRLGRNNFTQYGQAQAQLPHGANGLPILTVFETLPSGLHPVDPAHMTPNDITDRHTVIDRQGIRVPLTSQHLIVYQAAIEASLHPTDTYLNQFDTDVATRSGAILSMLESVLDALICHAPFWKCLQDKRQFTAILRFLANQYKQCPAEPTFLYYQPQQGSGMGDDSTVYATRSRRDKERITHDAALAQERRALANEKKKNRRNQQAAAAQLLQQQQQQHNQHHPYHPGQHPMPYGHPMPYPQGPYGMQPYPLQDGTPNAMYMYPPGTMPVHGHGQPSIAGRGGHEDLVFPIEDQGIAVVIDSTIAQHLESLTKKPTMCTMRDNTSYPCIGINVLQDIIDDPYSTHLTPLPAQHEYLAQLQHYNNMMMYYNKAYPPLTVEQQQAQPQPQRPPPPEPPSKQYHPDPTADFIALLTTESTGQYTYDMLAAMAPHELDAAIAEIKDKERYGILASPSNSDLPLSIVLTNAFALPRMFDPQRPQRPFDVMKPHDLAPLYDLNSNSYLNPFLPINDDIIDAAAHSLLLQCEFEQYIGTHQADDSYTNLLQHISLPKETIHNVIQSDTCMIPTLTNRSYLRLRHLCEAAASQHLQDVVQRDQIVHEVRTHLVSSLNNHEIQTRLQIQAANYQHLHEHEMSIKQQHEQLLAKHTVDMYNKDLGHDNNNTYSFIQKQDMNTLDKYHSAYMPLMSLANMRRHDYIVHGPDLGPDALYLPPVSANDICILDDNNNKKSTNNNVKVEMKSSSQSSPLSSSDSLISSTHIDTTTPGTVTDDDDTDGSVKRKRAGTVGSSSDQLVQLGAMTTTATSTDNKDTSIQQQPELTFDEQMEKQNKDHDILENEIVNDSYRLYAIHPNTLETRTKASIQQLSNDHYVNTQACYNQIKSSLIPHHLTTTPSLLIDPQHGFPKHLSSSKPWEVLNIHLDPSTSCLTRQTSNMPLSYALASHELRTQNPVLPIPSKPDLHTLFYSSVPNEKGEWEISLPLSAPLYNQLIMPMNPKGHLYSSTQILNSLWASQIAERSVRHMRTHIMNTGLSNALTQLTSSYAQPGPISALLNKTREQSSTRLDFVRKERFAYEQQMKTLIHKQQTDKNKPQSIFLSHLAASTTTTPAATATASPPVAVVDDDTTTTPAIADAVALPQPIDIKTDGAVSSAIQAQPQPLDIKAMDDATTITTTDPAGATSNVATMEDKVSTDTTTIKSEIPDSSGDMTATSAKTEINTATVTTPSTDVIDITSTITPPEASAQQQQQQTVQHQDYPPLPALLPALDVSNPLIDKLPEIPLYNAPAPLSSLLTLPAPFPTMPTREQIVAEATAELKDREPYDTGPIFYTSQDTVNLNKDIIDFWLHLPLVHSDRPSLNDLCRAIVSNNVPEHWVDNIDRVLSGDNKDEFKSLLPNLKHIKEFVDKREQLIVESQQYSQDRLSKMTQFQIELVQYEYEQIAYINERINILLPLLNNVDLVHIGTAITANIGPRQCIKLDQATAATLSVQYNQKILDCLSTGMPAPEISDNPDSWYLNFAVQIWPYQGTLNDNDYQSYIPKFTSIVQSQQEQIQQGKVITLADFQAILIPSEADQDRLTPNQIFSAFIWFFLQFMINRTRITHFKNVTSLYPIQAFEMVYCPEQVALICQLPIQQQDDCILQLINTFLSDLAPVADYFHLIQAHRENNPTLPTPTVEDTQSVVDKVPMASRLLLYYAAHIADLQRQQAMQEQQILLDQQTQHQAYLDQMQLQNATDAAVSTSTDGMGDNNTTMDPTTTTTPAASIDIATTTPVATTSVPEDLQLQQQQQQHLLAGNNTDTIVDGTTTIPAMSTITAPITAPITTTTAPSVAAEVEEITRKAMELAQIHQEMVDRQAAAAAAAGQQQHQQQQFIHQPQQPFTPSVVSPSTTAVHPHAISPLVMPHHDRLAAQQMADPMVQLQQQQQLPTTAPAEPLQHPQIQDTHSTQPGSMNNTTPQQ